MIDQLRSWQITERNGFAAVDRWVYRGQRDSSWSLTPSAFREGTELGYANTRFRRTVTGTDLDSWEQTQGEFYAVHEFLRLADQVGLDVPGDSQLFRQNAQWENTVGSTIGTAEWPPPSLLPTLAIAQHHGVPTRLLDVTYDPLVATWFAATDALAHTAEAKPAERMAVWVLDLHFLNARAQRETGLRFMTVTVPQARNAYLRAQSGLFLCDRHAAYKDTTDIALAVAQHAEYLRDPVAAGPSVTDPTWKPGYKFTLPAREAGALLAWLERLGYNKAKLQPSFDNVVAVLKGRRAGS